MENEKNDNSHIERLKCRSTNSLNWPALWFAYILIHGREEWVLVLLGSQHKCVERPLRPMFPDYLSVSMYRPLDQKLAYFLSSITDLIDHYLKDEDFIVIGDFNESENSPALDSLLEEQKCKNIIKNKTCFKSVKESCID